MMNEKIKELATEANDRTDDWMEKYNPLQVDWDNYRTQIFAELIIQECIKRIEGTTAPKIENMDSAQNYGYAQWWEGYDDRGADCIEKIKEHFGLWNDE